jgi:hypothetical protein
MPVSRRRPFPRLVRCLLLVGLVVGAGLVWMTAEAQAVTMPVDAGVYGPLGQRPSLIGLSADGSVLLAGYTHAHPTQNSHGHPFGHLDWTQWGSRQALARGAVWADSCQPDCARGVYRARRASVRVFGPRRGVFGYMTITSGTTTSLYRAAHRGGPGGGWIWSNES